MSIEGYSLPVQMAVAAIIAALAAAGFTWAFWEIKQKPEKTVVGRADPQLSATGLERGGGGVFSNPIGGGGNGSNIMGGGGASYPSRNMNDVRASDQDIRLALQFAADQGGQFQSYPSVLSDATWTALRLGYLDDGSAARAIEAGRTGNGGGGVTTFTMTGAGRKKLADLTASTPNPTRMVHGQRFIPGAGVVTYGAPYEAPLSGAIGLQGGSVIDNRGGSR